MTILYFLQIENEDDNIILCIIHNHNKFDSDFVALPPAIFTLCLITCRLVADHRVAEI